MSLEEALRLKTEELATLQLSYDEFVESSKELETEYEQSLQSAQNELQDKIKKISVLEDKIHYLTSENQGLKRENSTLQNEVSSLRSKVSQLDEKRISLETENEDIANQLRILEASEDSLKHKLTEAEEDIVFLNSDVEELKAARCTMEAEHTAEISALKKTLQEYEQAKSNAEHRDIDQDSPDKEELLSVIASKEEQVKELEAHTAELQKNITKLSNQHIETSQSYVFEISSLKEQVARQTEAIKEKEEELENLRIILHKAESDLSTIATVSNGIEHTEANHFGITADEIDTTVKEFDFSSQTLTFHHTSSNAGPPSPPSRPQPHPVLRKVSVVISSNNIDLIKQELSSLAENYESLKENNSRLLNKIQGLRGNILTCCRTRPPSDQEIAAGGKVCIDTSDDVDVLCHDMRTDSWRSFAFDHVWRADGSQLDVYADVEPVVVSILDGYNVCIMAYGQTGSGKTYTMDGYNDQVGVNYRTIQSIFSKLQQKKAQAMAQQKKLSRNAVRRSLSNNSLATANKGDFEFINPLPRKNSHDQVTVTEDGKEEDNVYNYEVQISMVEIYNEQVYDLLHEGHGGGQSDGVSLDIRQNIDGIVSVQGLRSVVVKNMDEVKQVFHKGNKNRATASTNLNEHSSRSHLIIQIDVSIEERDTDSNSVDSTRESMNTIGKLYLVDLAGSERINKSKAVGATMKEAVSINKSLLALGDVMEALDQKNKHIPYRNSKLTYLLQNALGGSARTMMIFTVCPTNLSYEESLFTLQFASRVRNISLGPLQSNHLQNKNLEQTIKTLKHDLKELKKKKFALDEQVLELKRELKKGYEKNIVPLEGKLKASEESKKVLEATVEKLTKQVGELSAKVQEDTDYKQTNDSEFDLLQRNFKKALDQIRDHEAEQARLAAIIKNKEREIETVRGALLRAYNAQMSSPTNKLSSPSGKDDKRASSTGRVAENSPRVVFKLEEGENVNGEKAAPANVSPINVNGMIKPALKTTPPASKDSSTPSRHFFPPSPTHSSSKSNNGSKATSKSITKPLHNPPSATGKTVKTAPSVSTSTSSTPSGAKTSLMLQTSTPSRSAASSGPPGSPSSTKRKAVRTSLSSVSEISAPASSSSSAAATSIVNKMPVLSARSEDALKRHRMRMEKRREALLYGHDNIPKK